MECVFARQPFLYLYFSLFTDQENGKFEKKVMQINYQNLLT